VIGIWRAAALAAWLAGCATADDAAGPLAPYEDPALDALVSKRMETFRDEAEFIQYLKDVKAAAKARGAWWAGRNERLFAAAPVECDEEPCPKSDAAKERIVITGARLPASRSITNTQKTGVDEGDIVKQFGRFLIVLQDGRLFSVDTAGGLKLVARADVYRDPNADTWYDEMLISGDRLVVLGYSYDFEASEIAVFTIGADGSFAHDGTFYLSSDDYYSRRNYATRLVDDNLIVYTPVDLYDIDPEKPIEWPQAWRWSKDRSGFPRAALFDAASVYKPVQRTIDPAIHAVSVCPLARAGRGDALACATTAFVAPWPREYYVSRTDALLWIANSYNDIDPKDAFERCAADRKPQPGDGAPAALFRLPLAGGAPKVLFTRGWPNDQFALETSDREFRALLRWEGNDCRPDDHHVRLRYFRAPLAAFRDAPRTAEASSYTDVPAPNAPYYENRFTDTHVVYGGRQLRSSSPPDEWDTDEIPLPWSTTAVAVPVDAPKKARAMQLPHNVIRAERMGDDIVLTGYRDENGLSVSVVDLSGRPHIADTEILRNRYESEGRSHAFNSLVDEDGAGLLGLPTVLNQAESGRWSWRSGPSDVSFLSVDQNAHLAGAGELLAREGAQHPDYKCEVSCVDWYGNTRAIFADGRIFALAGTELIEGAVEAGRLAEIRRLNLTAPARFASD